MKVDHRSLLSGQTTGPLAAAARASLRMASWAYAAAAVARTRQYDRGRRPIFQAAVPVISVGNLTTGGTGKTPVVCDLCQRIRSKGLRVAIISRGYGAGETGINDEAMELAQRLPDVPHVQHPDRVEAARIAVEELEAEILVMDDGFQHRRLHRDLDLVVIDATCPFGFDAMLPRGYLREPVSSLRRAAAVCLTRTDQIEPAELDRIRHRIRDYLGDRPIIETMHAAEAIAFDDGTVEPVETLRGRSVALISAIGNPDAFERTVRDCGADILAHHKLPDHDAFERQTRTELQQWTQTLTGLGSQGWLICTHKDAVKLSTDRIAGIPLGTLRIALSYRGGEETMDDLLDGVMRV